MGKKRKFCGTSPAFYQVTTRDVHGYPDKSGAGGNTCNACSVTRESSKPWTHVSRAERAVLLLRIKGDF